MRDLFLITLLFSLLSGCNFFYSISYDCDDYCEGTVIHECTNDGGGFGGSINRSSYDCSKEDKICTSEYGYPGCYYVASKCEDGVQSFCKDKTIFDCEARNGAFYSNPGEDCLTDEVCVEFPGYASCLIPVDECDSEAEAGKVCMDNKIVKCYENDGEFYVTYIEDCEDEECVEVGDRNVICLVPVEECTPSENDICIDNQIGRCYEINDSFYIYSKYD